MSEPVFDKAQQYLSFEDTDDAAGKSSDIAAVYFGVATQKANTDMQIAEANSNIKQRKCNLYLQYRDQTTDSGKKKFTEGEVEAMLQVDSVLAQHYSHLTRLEIASKLQFELLAALRMSADIVKIVLSNQSREMQMAGRS